MIRTRRLGSYFRLRHPFVAVLRPLFAIEWLPNVLVIITQLAVILAGVNVAIICIAGGYDSGVTGIVAHSLFKPLQYVNGAVIVSILVARKRPSTIKQRVLFGSGAWFLSAALLLASAIYWLSFPLNFACVDWTHRHISAGITDLHKLLSLFATPQADGFYRPLGFVSLWIDYRLFGPHFAPYHLQSLLLHAFNAFLAYRCYRALGFSEWCSQWAALLFCAAAVCFETVIWPAARFDLLATAFMMTSLLIAVVYMRAGRAPALVAFTAAYAAALLSKETAFALPVMLVIAWFTRDFMLSCTKRLVHLEAIAAGLVAVSFLVRVAVYGNVGGYNWNGGESPHFALSFKTLTSLLTRAFATSQLTINAAAALPFWMRAAVIGFAAGAVLICFGGRTQSRARQVAVLGFVCAAALPVVNILGWIGPTAGNSRYLYLPAMWIFLFLTSSVEGSRVGTAALSLILIANAAGALHHVAVLRDTLARADAVAASIHSAAVAHGASEVQVSGITSATSLNGWLYFGDEVVTRARRELPNTRVTLIGSRRPDHSQGTVVLHCDEAPGAVSIAH